LRPLIDFPDVDKIYESKELWQFFLMRILSPAQAEVEEILKGEHIREDDAVSLLKRFGERTITNPFRLRAVRDRTENQELQKIHAVAKCPLEDCCHTC
jgi:hypothetical protein